MRRIMKGALVTSTLVVLVAVSALAGAMFTNSASATSGDYCAPCPETRYWTTGPENILPRAYANADVVSIRQGLKDCYQRIVFDVNSNAAVGYSAAYVEQARAVGSGKPIDVQGDSVLKVTVNAEGRTLGAPGKPFLVEADFRPASPVNEVRFGGSFEGQSVFYVGLDGQPDFAASDSYSWNTDDTEHVIVDFEL